MIDLNTIIENLSLILLGGMGVFFLLFFIFGLFFRFKRALYKFVCWIIFQVLLFVLADTFCNFIYNLPVTIVTENFEMPEYINGSTITEIIENLEIQYMGAADAATTSYLLGIVSILIKFIYIVILSFIFYLLFSIVTGIIYAIFFRRRKKEKAMKAEGKKIKKHHFLAGLTNGVRGVLFYCLALVVLVTGPLSIVDTSVFSTEEAESGEVVETTDGTSTFDTEEIMSIIDAVKNTGLYKFLTKGDEKSISNLINGQIWSFKTEDGTKIDVHQELSDLFSVAPEIMNIVESSSTEGGEIDYSSLKTVLYQLSESDFITSILPVAVNVATSIDSVNELLTQYNIEADQLKGIDWKSDLVTIGDMCDTVGSLMGSISYLEGKEHTIQNIDLSSISEEKITILFSKLGDLTIVQNLINSIVEYALSLESVQAYIDETVINVNEIVWKDEFVNIGKIVNCLLDLGFESIDEISGDFKAAFSKLDFGDKEDANDTGKVGKLFDTIFASALVAKVFPSIMEKVVLTKISDDYKDLFDFSSVAKLGWNNEINYLLGIFKDVNSDPETALFTDEGGLNYDVIKNVSASTILNSQILRKALVETFMDCKESKGLLASMSSTIIVPDEFSRTISTWCKLETNYYVPQEDLTDDIKKYDRVSVETYATLTADQQSKCEISYKVTGGELYDLVNALKELLNIVDLNELTSGEGGTSSLLNSETLNALVETSTTDNTKTVCGVVCESKVLKATLSNLLSGTEGITIPSSAIDTSITVTITHEDSPDTTVKVLKTEELEALISAAAKLDLFNDDGSMKELGVGLVNDLGDVVDEDTGKTKLDYVLDSQILHATVSKAITDAASDLLVVPADVEATNYSVYENLGDAKVIKKSELKAMVTAFIKLGLVGEDGNVNAPGIELVETLNNKVAETDEKTKLGYCLDSDIMHATLSKVIVDSAGSVISIPSNAYSTKGTTNVISATELEALITGINKLGIINNGNIEVDTSLLTDLNEKAVSSDTKTKLDYVYESKILAVTISEKLVEQKSTLVIPSVIFETVGDKQQVVKSELEATVDAIKAIGGVDNIANAATALLGTTDEKIAAQEDVSKSLIIRATLCNSVAQEILSDGTPLDALDTSVSIYRNSDGDTQTTAATGYSFVPVFTETEVKAMLYSLSMLEITSFDQDVDVGKIFSFTDAELDTFLSSKCLLTNLSNNIINVNIFDSVKAIANPSLVRASTTSPIGTYPVSYASYKSYTNTTTNIYCYDQDLISQMKRLTVSEVKAVMSVVKIINGGTVQSGKYINIDTTGLSNIYKDATKCTQLCAEVAKSVFLTYAIPEILASAVDDAAGSSASAINLKIAELNVADRSLWNDFGLSEAYDYSTYHQLNDNELYHLLTGLGSVSNVSSASFTKTDLNNLDASYCLRTILEDVITGYSASDSQANRTTAINTFCSTYHISD